MRDALGWSHLCLVCDGDTWFRDRHVFGFFDRLIDDGFFEEFDQVIFYGAGPCGYAAAAFSVASPGRPGGGAAAAGDARPAGDGMGRPVPAHAATDFTSRFGYAPDMLDAAEQAYIVYDPEQALDAMHAALFHPAQCHQGAHALLRARLQAMLLRMGVLYRMLAQVSAGKFTRVNRARLLRGRQDNPAYQFNLLRHLRRSKRHGLVIQAEPKGAGTAQRQPLPQGLKEAQHAMGRQEDDRG